MELQTKFGYEVLQEQYSQQLEVIQKAVKGVSRRQDDYVEQAARVCCKYLGALQVQSEQKYNGLVYESKRTLKEGQKGNSHTINEDLLFAIVRADQLLNQEF